MPLPKTRVLVRFEDTTHEAGSPGPLGPLPTELRQRGDGFSPGAKRRGEPSRAPEGRRGEHWTRRVQPVPPCLKPYHYRKLGDLEL